MPQSLLSDLRASPPAVLGGEPIRSQGPPGWPPRSLDLSTVWAELAASGAWGRYHGAYCRQLEARLAEYHQTEFVHLCCSGTFAIELALRALQLREGEEVIVAGYDFLGNFNNIVTVGGRPVLVDLDPQNWNLDPGLIASAISGATRGLIVSHLHGGVVSMREIMEIARGNNLWVIEDACQMPGAVIQGQPAGTWGDVGILSFGGSKLLTAGRGGALLTRSPDIHQRARLYCNRGNHAYPLSEMQAAVLLPQLDRLDEWNRVRAGNVATLTRALQGTVGLTPLSNSLPETKPGYYKLGFQYHADEFAGLSRDGLVEAALAEGIAFSAGFQAFHRCRSSRRFRQGSDLEMASLAHQNMVVLHHPVLLEESAGIEQVARCVHKLHAWRAELASS